MGAKNVENSCVFRDLRRASRGAFAALAGLMLALWAPAAAAQGDSGGITGYVFDQSGGPIKGVKIVASSSTQIGGSKTTYSNEEGYFRFVQLSPGKFEVRASAPNLKTVLQKDIQVGISAAAEVTLVMDVQTEEETVKVVEKAPLVNTTKAAIKQTFDLDFVEMLPHNDRDDVHRQMVNGVPGAMSGRVRGGAENQTQFTQDGFDMRGQYPTLKSSAAYEVQTGGYGADAPTASGGVVNLVTKSGSNKWEFEFNGTADNSDLRFFKDSRDAAKNYYYVLNPSVSGPIVRDRLWFAFNFESHFQGRVRDRPVDAAYLPDPQPFEKSIHKGTLKLTWQVSPRNKLSSLNNFDFVREDNRRDDAGVDASAQEDRNGRRYFTGLVWESLLSDSLVLRSQAGYITNPQHIYPAACDYDPENCNDIASIQQKNPRNIWYGNNNNHERNDITVYQFNNRLEWFSADHGVALKNNYYTEQDIRRISRPGNFFEEWTGTTPEARTQYWSNDPRVDAPREGWFITSVIQKRNTLTLSDQWRMTRYLTVTPALSHIYASATNSRGDAIVGTQTWAPSVTGVWDPTRDGRTALRGGFSTYVDVDAAGSQASQRCKYDAATGRFDKECTYSGGLTRNTFGSPCGPTNKNVDGSDCSETLEIPRTWEYTFGAQREIVQGVALSLDGVYRSFRNQYETRETNRVWLPSGEALDPTGGFRNGRNETITDLGTPDSAKRRYVGVTAGVVKREGNLKVSSSYTWSRLDGNVFNGRNNYFGDIPGRDVYTYGPLPDDHRHEVKAQLTYILTSWAGVGVRYAYFSGLPYRRLFRNDVTGNFENLRSGIGYDAGANINDPGDDRAIRRPDQQDLNVQFRVNWMPLIGQRLDTYVDVLNVLALRTTTTVGEEDGRNFGEEINRMNPFRIRIGLNYKY
jgi:hypothetical protein